MSQVEQQNTHQNSLFKSFSDIKVDNNHEQINSHFKSVPTNNVNNDIMSKYTFMKIMYLPIVLFWMLQVMRILKTVKNGL